MNKESKVKSDIDQLAGGMSKRILLTLIAVMLVALAIFFAYVLSLL